jgi:hypothetical protein
MPPQQPDRLLDLFNEAFDFRAHGLSDLRGNPPLVICFDALLLREPVSASLENALMVGGM